MLNDVQKFYLAVVIHMSVCMNVCVRVWVYVCMYICMYVIFNGNCSDPYSFRSENVALLVCKG